MSVQLHEPGYDDQQLVRYLLGLLPVEDAEHLDELSICDGELAWRLRAAENDLVDDYVNGALTGETRARFESFYVWSERRREQVRFARALHRRARRRGPFARLGVARTNGADRTPPFLDTSG